MYKIYQKNVGEVVLVDLDVLVDNLNKIYCETIKDSVSISTTKLKYHSKLTSKKAEADLDGRSAEELYKEYLKDKRVASMIATFNRKTKIQTDSTVNNDLYQAFKKSILDSNIKHGAKLVVTADVEDQTVYEYDVNNAYAYFACSKYPDRESFEFGQFEVADDDYLYFNDFKIVHSGKAQFRCKLIETPALIKEYFEFRAVLAKDKTQTQEVRDKAKLEIVVNIGAMVRSNYLFRMYIVDACNYAMEQQAAKMTDVFYYNTDAIFTTTEQDDLFELSTKLGAFKKKTHTNFNNRGTQYFSDQARSLRGIAKSKQQNSFVAKENKYSVLILDHKIHLMENKHE